jgi:CPA1 family monovalent cation:H+ antiporter
MGLYYVVTILVVITAVFSYLNSRFIHLHVTVGVMLISMVSSLALIAGGRIVPGLAGEVQSFVSGIPFKPLVLQWMLGFLLFAGALTVDVRQLAAHRGLTAALIIVGTTVSTILIGALAWGLSRIAGLDLSPIDSLLLGAILSPTDPVAVLGVINRSGAPGDIRNIVAAESLFNDGIGVVLFLFLLAVRQHDGNLTAWHAAALLARQTVGGIALGWAAGWFGHIALRTTTNFQTEVLLTVATAMGSYAAAGALGMSGPIAVVVAGLVVADFGLPIRSAAGVRDELAAVWELVDELMNAVLFVLIGLQVMVLAYSRPALAAGLLMIPAALLARGVTVAGVMGAAAAVGWPLPRGVWKLLTWGGLRGGLALAMALSTPAGPVRDAILIVTYVVVVFSVAVQGTTTRPLVQSMARQ